MTCAETGSCLFESSDQTWLAAATIKGWLPPALDLRLIIVSTRPCILTDRARLSLCISTVLIPEIEWEEECLREKNKIQGTSKDSLVQQWSLVAGASDKNCRHPSNKSRQACSHRLLMGSGFSISSIRQLVACHRSAARDVDFQPV